MKVPGDFSELVTGTPAEAIGQAAVPTFDAPEQAQEGGDFRARLSKAADHISGQVARYADVDGFNQDVREVRALNELGKLTQTERQAAAMEDPAAKAEQDAYANLDKMDWRESDLILDKAAGSPSLMDTYTPPPGARPMDSEKAQEIAQSTLQKFGLVDQAQIDATKERKLMDAVEATGLPRELLESGDPSATVRNFKEQGGAVEAFARMHPVTAGFVHEFANLVRPDWQELSWPEQIGRNFMAGTMQGQAQVKLAMVMDRVRSQGMTPELMAEAWQYDKDIKNASGLPMDDWANKIAGNSAQQLPQFAYGATEAAKYAATGLAMGVAGEVATGGALAVPMLAWGAKVGYAEFSRKLEGGLALWELLNMKDPAGNHLPYKAAAIGSDIVGGINAAIELWELDTIAKTIPGVRKVMADVGKEAALKTLLSPSFRQVLFQGSKAFAGFEAKEIGQEMLQELTQVASEEINKAYANKTGASFGQTTMAEIRDRLYDIGEKTFWGMIPFGGPGVAWTTGKDAVQTPQARKLLDPFMARIGADKLAQESPSMFERLIERNVQAGAFPGKVYMPSADVRTLFQDKTSGAVDVEGLRAFLSAAGIDRQVFLDSLDHSADVAMDSKRLARVLATDAGAALHSQGNLTFSPGEREVARAEAQVEQAQATGDPERIAQAQATLKEVESGISEQDRATLDSLFQSKVDLGRSFKERIVADMIGAGHTKAQARVAASLIDGNAQVWAENTGQTVEAYYKKFGYRIKKTNFGGILAQIYQKEYAVNFKSEAGFFERFNRDEGFRQEVLAKVNLGAPAEAAQVVAPVAPVAPVATQTQAPVATAAVTVPTATSSSQAAGASPAASVEVGPTHEVVRVAEDQALEAQRWAALEGFQAAGWTAETRMDRPMFTKDGLEVWPSGFGQDVGVVVVKVAGAPTWSGSLNRTVRMEAEETAADFAARVEAEGRAMLPAPALSPEVAAIVARGEALARQVLPGETVDAAKAALAQAGPTVESVLRDIGVVGPQGPVQMLYQDRAAMPKSAVVDKFGQKFFESFLQDIDEWGRVPSDVPQRVAAYEEMRSTLRAKGVEYIDAYHVSDVQPAVFRREGIRGSSLDYVGGYGGNLRDSSVYLFLDADEIPLGYPGITGARSPVNTVAHIRIPLSKLEDIRGDSNFHMTFGTPSAVRLLGDIKPDMIAGYAEFDALGLKVLRYSPAALNQDHPAMAGVDMNDAAQVAEAQKLWSEMGVESPYFKAWFRDSKVVDAQGKPLVVYHGTDKAFDSFDRKRLGDNTAANSAKLGFFFTNDSRVAKSYADYAALDTPVQRVLKEADEAEKRGDWDTYDAKIVEAENLEAKLNDPAERMRGQNLVPTYLTLKNPLVIDAGGEMYTAIEDSLTAQIKKAKRDGNDGVIIKNLDDAAGLANAVADHYVVFSPTQIKSVFNRGTFDASDPRILYQDSGPKPPQGASVFSNDNQAVIHFFEAKDVSTAPHEIFHVFRRVLQDIAMHPSANEQVRADWAGACEFVGAQVGQEWSREQEEKWADAGLTYLMEGKAPSQNLKGAFSRMADWLLAVYRSVRNMVSLSPQIRGVFDRLLATQDEIRAAEDRLQTVPLFTEKRSVDYEAALAELKQATEEEVRAYRIGKLNSLRKLWAKDGKAIADNAEHQKKIDALVEAGGVRVPDSELSSGNRASIKRHRPGKLLIGPDAAMSEHEAADMVGVPRLAFWAWLSAAQTKSAIVKEHVAAQERMFNDEFDVDEVMLSERLEKVLELEARTLAEALGGRSVPASALKAWVREKTGQTKADQALVGEFDALKEVLRRESMAARKAFREGKNKEALQAKERQRAALSEIRTRIKDQKTALTIQARAVRISEAVLNKNSKVDWDWGEQVLRLVVHFGLNEKRKSIFPRQADTMPGLLQFIQAKDADGYETHNGNIPEWIYAEGQGQLGRQNPNHWKKLSMAQLREVDTALRYLYEAGKRERLYVTDGKEIELVTVADKLIRSMDGLKNVRRLADYEKSQPLGWLLNKKRQYIAEITNPEYLWDAVDGFEAEGARGKRTGPAWQYVRMALMQARSAELREYGRVATAMDKIFHPMRERNVRERFTLDGVPLMSEVAEEWGGLWNYERLVSAAMNMGNAGNLHALSAGFGWTQDHLALIAKQLTAAEWRMVQDVWDLVETLWPAVDQTFYALHGQHMQKVEALPLTVQTKDGQEITLRGGYYPLIGDHRLNDKAGQFAEADLMKNETMALFTPAKVKDSFTLKRTGMVLPPRLSLSVMSRHVQQAVHYATHGVQVRNLQRIITLPEFSAAFKAKFGEDQYRMLTPWLKNIARPDSPQLGFFEQTLEKWRTLGTISALGLNAQVAFLQITSLPQSAQSIGWDYIAKAYSAMADPTQTATLVAFVRENSPLMRDRFHDMDRDMARNAQKFNPTDRKLQFQVGEQHIELGMQEFHEFAMLPIAFADCLVTYPTWLAAFMKAQADNNRDISKGLPGKPVEELYRMADDQVIRAQAGGSAMNLSALQHGAGWRRLITMFASFMMNYQNRLRHYARGVVEGKISKVDYARHLFNETLLPVVLTSIMLKLLKDNDLPDKKDLAWDFGGYLLSGFPIFRGMPRIMQYGMGGVMDSAAWRGVDLAAKAGRRLIAAATDQGKRSEHLLAFIKDATDMAGFAAGVPTVPIWRFAKGVHDLAAGSEKNPFRPFFSPSPDAKKK